MPASSSARQSAWAREQWLWVVTTHACTYPYHAGVLSAAHSLCLATCKVADGLGAAGTMAPGGAGTPPGAGGKGHGHLTFQGEQRLR